ncbi:MAG: hypothetical protein KC766_06085 [Myxococcales bacterium]|nr:hypothetical protein [Myxococcales bacterium]
MRRPFNCSNLQPAAGLDLLTERPMRRWRLASGAVLLAPLVAASCKDRPQPPSAVTGSASASVAPTALAPRCTEVSRGASFVIGKPSPAKQGDEDQALDLPFAVELGRAHAFEKGFLVTALRSVAGQSQAMLASLNADASGGRIVELGRVHGDVEPPLITVGKNHVFVGVADHDASSAIVRLASISKPTGEPQVTWGALPQIGGDASEAFDMALGEERGVLAYDDYKKADGHSSVWTLTFGLDDPSKVTPARVVSLKGQDVEAPKLAERPGGFWLAWIAHSKLETESKPKPSEKNIDLESLVELGTRWLELVKLDENGVRVGEPLKVSAEDGHVLVFDLMGAPDGSAWLAWRDDATSPGVERRAVLLARVDASGSKTDLKIEDERVGAGVPNLLEVAPPTKQVAWLGLGTASDRTSFLALAPDFKPVEDLDNDPLVGPAELLAARDDEILLGRPQGLACELSVVRCAPRFGSAGQGAGASEEDDLEVPPAPSAAPSSF